jgi:predicted ATPase
MWIEELVLDNVKCFEQATFRFGTKTEPNRWTTLLSENGGGKSTVLQAISLLLAGPESAQRLLSRPIGWLRDESKAGKISIRMHQGHNDPGSHGFEKIRTAFGYSYHLTGQERITIRNKLYTEPGVHENSDRTLTWLRQNAFSSQDGGWFAVGYGAFRRLTRSSQIIVPSLEPSARFTNFLTQFAEDETLSAFERWMVYLDYRIAKEKDVQATRMMELGIKAINQLLPDNVSFNNVDQNGRIIFDVYGNKVPTISLSDGYRSVLALAGDLVWRLIQAFPNSENPLNEQGVIVVDELDIHLHPVWQRSIAGLLRKQFPNMQFIVATHSPMVAAGAGEDAITLRFKANEGVASISTDHLLFAKSVDEILQSEAFGFVSPYSPQTEKKLADFEKLVKKGSKRTPQEAMEYNQLSLFMNEYQPLGVPKQGSLDSKVDAFLAEHLK